MPEPDFDVERFLVRPLTARLATGGGSGRTAVRPVWYLWEEGRSWILVGAWNRIPSEVEADPDVALVVDTCDLFSGECLQARWLMITPATLGARDLSFTASLL
ncbi:MAG: pyridoxamine 5'-phosphate oxidase family protein [Acidimicrobiales bacterium]